MKDNKFVGRDSIPPEELDKLGDPSKNCLFCGVLSKLPKLVDNHIVYLCTEHYYAKNTGQIAQKLRNPNG